MTYEEAKKIITETFGNRFEKEVYKKFIVNFLKDVNFDKRFSPQTGNYIFNSFRDFIDQYERIGQYEDKEGNIIDILIVKLKRNHSVEYARHTQRNFIREYLNKEQGGILRDAALVAFYSEGFSEWRFSLVKMEYSLNKKKEELTPARRFSFLVGEGENNHTAQKQLLPVLMSDNPPVLNKELIEAFNIEKVTEEFFEKYRNLFIRTVDELNRIVKSSERVRKDFKEKNVNTVELGKKLLEQITFLYFLQKKGWFGVTRDGNWGTGPKDFLRRLFNKEYGDYKNFFNDILEPLFYEALNNEREDNYYSKFNCKIPFLNGGLFEPAYDWIHTDINLPDSLFSNNNITPEGDTGDGILDVFDRFNFTVKEDEPLEKEVAVDPELLGKLYEKFNAIRPNNFYKYKQALTSGKKSLEKKFNKEYGVYYTPREIVHYMCRQSLIYYLSNELQGVVSIKDITEFIENGRDVIENDETVEKKGRETRTYQYKLPEAIRKNAEIIDKKLKDIKIVDPAVGSGAFPVGMMHEIIQARDVLHRLMYQKQGCIYNFKRECIEDSLYGVDIDAGACEVTKLRLWLSLIVDEEDISNIKPLPNLDYKIVQGNSLLGVEKDLFNSHLFSKLEDIKHLYFNETSHSKKIQYKKEIEELIFKITKGHKIFDFEVYFSEVFHSKCGFDVVIGNPPYVQIQKFSGKPEQKHWESQGYKTYNRMGDIYELFYERGNQVLAEKGILSFITSNKWMRAGYGKQLRKYFIENTNPLKLIDFGGYKVFESATVDTNILIFEKDKYKNRTLACSIKNDFKKGQDISEYVNKNSIVLKKLSEESWIILNKEEYNIKRKIEKIGTPLKDWDINIYRGILTGFNEAFIIDGKTKDELIKQDPKSAEIIKPILRGRDIKRYYAEFADLWLINTHNGYKNSQGKRIPTVDINKYPAIKKHLDQFKKELEKRQDKGITPYNLRNCAYLEEFEKEKIVYQELTQGSSFAFDKKGNTYISNTAYLITGKSLKYLLALLNSRAIEYYFGNFISISLGEKGIRWLNQYMQNLFIPQILELKQKPFIKLVDKIIKKKEKGEDTTAEENQIDIMVYKLYNLSYDEVKIIDPNIEEIVSKSEYEKFEVIGE